jgi:hypothetical protein
MRHFMILLAVLAIGAPLGALQAGTVGFWDFRNLTPGSLAENDRISDSSGNARDLRVGSGTTGPPSVSSTGPLPGQTSMSFGGNAGGEMLIFEPGFSGFNGGGPAAGTEFDIGPVGAGCPTCVGESFTHETIVFLPSPTFGDQLGADERGVFGKGGLGEPFDHWGLNTIGPRDTPPTDSGDTWLEHVFNEWIEDTPSGFFRSQSFIPNVGGDRSEVPTGWHHIAVTRNRNTDRQQVFIDGVELGDFFIPSRQIVPNNTNAFFVIGARGSNNNRAWRGNIALVKLSDQVLDPSEFMPIPEPSTAALLLIGFLGFVARHRRK